ncbi:MAG: glutamyl-tRNA synthetase [Bradymonadia bacterium]|jgi:glutamyl-tRNA synthetase
MSVRVRFAPSPTGFLHMGGVRTALFNWLYARHHDGKFLLRVEDTDKARSKDEYTDVIREAMTWLGMDVDEPVVLQSEREPQHIAAANELLAAGKAYKCFCTSEELAAMRERGAATGDMKYDGMWRDRDDHPTDGTPFVLRFKMPLTGATTVNDQVLGPVTIQNDQFDDFVILRSDGTPTYNFVVVCDDAFMKITHVMRGQDHVNNAFKQLHLYKAMGFDVPAFAHLPLIKGLSKRIGSVSVQHYRDLGFLREAVINYIARLGWSHGDDEIFSPEELISLFDLPGVNRSPGTYDEQKMAWVNSQWMKKLSVQELAQRALPFVNAAGIDASLDDKFLGLTTLVQPRADDLVAFTSEVRFAYEAPTEYAEKAVKKWMKAGNHQPYLTLMKALEDAPNFEPSDIDAAFTMTMEAHEVGMGKIAQPVRVALTGTAVSPSIHETVSLVGRDECLRRMQAAVHLFPDA